MIRILFFADNLTEGGAEKVLRTLVNNMNQEKFEITVHTVEKGDAEGLLKPGIRYRAINRCRTAWGKKLFSYWIRLCAELKWLYPLYIKDDYDIEVAYLECGPTKILAGSTNQKAKKIAWVHCDLKKRPSLAVQAEKLKQYYRSYDRVVCVSEAARESYVDLFGENPASMALYNVNDEKEILEKANAFRVEKGAGFTILSVGRLSYEKGNDRLLEACKRLKEEGYSFRLWIVGEGPERIRLTDMATEFGLKERVTFWGFQENPYPYMKAADVIVCASRYEGFSTVMTEAMILGKAAVTTPCAGMRELLGESEYGLITEDSVAGIYRGIKVLLDDPELQTYYAKAAALRAETFTKAKTVGETERFFSGLLR